MNKMVNNLGAGVALAISLSAQAQDSVTVSVGPAPLVENESENALASITVSETVPDALTPGGWFSLYFRENPDQSLSFTSASSASGALTTLTPRGFLLSVQVAGSDTTLDSITIEPHAFLDFHSDSQDFANSEFSVELIDGDVPPFMGGGENPRAGIGSAAGSYVVGRFGEVMELELGFEVDVEVGETITQDILTSTGAFLGPYSVESEDPAIATISASGSQALIMGVSAGMTYVYVEDSLGRSDHMIVNVLPAPAVVAGPGAVSGPEPGTPPAPPTPSEDPVTPTPPETPATPPPAETPATPTPAETPAPGAPEEVPVSTPPAQPPANPAGGEPPAPPVAGSVGSTTASAASVLTLLPSAVLGGGSTDARVSAGAMLLGGDVVQSSFQAGQNVSVEAEIQPEGAQVNQPAELFVAVHVSTPSGASAWFQQNAEGGFSAWDGSVDNLQPAASTAALGSVERVSIHEGALLAGRYELYVGYMVEGETLIYSATPLVLTVQ